MFRVYSCRNPRLPAAHIIGCPRQPASPEPVKSLRSEGHKTIYKKIEMAANVAIIVVAVLLATVIVRNDLISPRLNQATDSSSTLKPEDLSALDAE